MPGPSALDPLPPRPPADESSWRSDASDTAPRYAVALPILRPDPPNPPPLPSRPPLAVARDDEARSIPGSVLDFDDGDSERGKGVVVPGSVTVNVEDSGDSAYKSVRTGCGCCHICVTVGVLFLVGIGLAVFFLFPQVPGIKVIGVFPSPTLPPVTFKVNPSGVLLHYVGNISVQNLNYIDLSFSKITIKGWDSGIAIGNGTLTNLLVPMRATSTIYFPVSIYLDTTMPDGLFATVVAQCGGGPEGWAGRSQITVQYTVTIWWKLIAFTGFVPSYSSQATFDCPLNLTQ
ncbi:hypothetical protein BDK51DRAFT_30934 [Blyttiomyces helicus]|uniref:Late embryogenesis abundant protein LEA-2 subgroup domain-containing protein n=1 Tax=Blyttiomyces helicus TaxID=388810 RepID=A0A4P9W6P3_9FUNG|nr:hypothetical protein BDK51DRAFT_30934 [Blyttiomyces helicus]|eukprot:RKO88131.1 hypothetical protein BDK51DRAFT_30934 [Blyttiomyces helicus]